MGMFISSLLDGGATPALASTLTFNERRLKMIAENVANWGTPHYRTKQLDTRAFQRSLRKALDQHASHKDEPFKVSSGKEVSTDDNGYLKVTPSQSPVENVLFHDGTNMSIERQMADLAETGMTHELVATLLKGRVDGLGKAIRGSV